MNADCRRTQIHLCKQVLSKLGAHLPQLLWHIIWVFAFHNFLAKQNQLFNFISFFFLRQHGKDGGDSHLVCLPGRSHGSASSAEGPKHTTTLSDAKGRALSAGVQGLRCGRRCIVLHGTRFPDSNINRFFSCVLFTVRRNLIFPNGPL